MADTPEKKSIFARIGKFFRDQKAEIKKIVWPSKKQIINNTAIVLAATAIFAVVTGGFDWLIGMIVRAIYGA